MSSSLLSGFSLYDPDAQNRQSVRQFNQWESESYLQNLQQPVTAGNAFWRPEQTFFGAVQEEMQLQRDIIANADPTILPNTARMIGRGTGTLALGIAGTPRAIKDMMSNVTKDVVVVPWSYKFGSMSGEQVYQESSLARMVAEKSLAGKSDLRITGELAWETAHGIKEIPANILSGTLSGDPQRVSQGAAEALMLWAPIKLGRGAHVPYRIEPGRSVNTITATSEFSILRQTARFLKEEGLDMSLRRDMIESGFKGTVGADTPVTLARFRKLFPETVAAGKSFRGRLGNKSTRVHTIMEARALEQIGLRPKFEYWTGRNAIDLVGRDPVTRKPVVPAIQFVKWDRLWREEIPRGFQITRDTDLPVRYVVTGE